MEIEFSKHALDQLKIRSSITKAMVLETLKEPNNSSTSYRGREVYRKKYDQEILEVIAIKEDNKLIVITQYFLEQ
jgi:uncharacterized protein DUF4258